MKTIGERFPTFRLKAVDARTTPDKFGELSSEELKGQWSVVFYWPKDFTFVCPTEIVGFDALYEQFADRDVKLVGASTDTEFVHLAWRNSREDLGRVRYPWLADYKRELATELGVLHPTEGVAMRATFIVDPDGIIRHVSVNDLDVGRNPEEILRLIDALQTDELCPCNWQKGEETIHVA